MGLPTDPLLIYDPELAREGPEYEECEVLGVAVKLIIMPDPEHEHGGNYTSGWKLKVGAHQYGNFIGHLSTREEARQVKQTLLEQCAATIEAIRKKEATDGATN